MPRPINLHRTAPAEATSAARAVPGTDFLLEWIGGRTGPNERRQVVVLACDFAPTDRTEGALDLEDLAEMLSSRRRTIAEIVGRYGGAVAAMTLSRQIVCWGWPQSREDDPRLAVAASLEIVEHLGPHCHCALDAGIAVVDARTDRFIEGSQLVAPAVGNVHTMLAKAPAGSILITSTVRSLLGGVFDLEPFGPPSHAADGTSRAWTVRGALAGRTNAAWVPPETLFGRRQEQAALAQTLSEVTAGAMRCIWIHGGAGIGKTALLADLKVRIADAGATFIEAHCLPETQGTFLSLAHQILDDLTDLGLAVSKPLAEQLGVAPAGLDAVAFASTVAGMLAQHRGAGPIAIGIEDEHWADTQSRDFIRALSMVLSGASSLLLVVTSRSPAPDLLLEAKAWTALELGPLTVADLQHMLRAPALSPELPEATGCRSQGMPKASRCTRANSPG